MIFERGYTVKLKKPDVLSGWRPYAALALVMLLLYFAASPFISLNTGSTKSGLLTPFSGQSDNRGAPSGISPSGSGQGRPSGDFTPGGKGGTVNGSANGTSSGSFKGERQNVSGAGKNAGEFQKGPHSSSSAADGDLTARAGMIAGIAVLLIAAGALYYKRRLTPRRAGVAVIAAGFVMRFGYMLYTSYSARGHDVGDLNGTGHLAYLYTLYKNFSLPASNSGQFYHPPLNYILEAVFAHIYAFVTQSTNIVTILESARLVPCFASCALLIVLYRLFGELGFDNTAKLVAVSLVAFHPTFFILSASINNDMLMIFFFTAALLYTVRWYHHRSFKNIILLAVTGGCAMMTKFSGALILSIAGTAFLIALVQDIKAGRFKYLIGQFAAFVGVFWPIGTWYYIRNLILFGQPVGYVLQLGVNSNMNTGDKSFFERFVSFPPRDLFSSVYCNTSGDYRLWIYTVKCSLFGEFSFNSGHYVPAVILIVLNVLLILLSLAAMVYVLFRCKKTSAAARWGFFGIWLLQLVSFLYFNIKYPLTCTMDFRYLVPTLFTGAFFLGLACSQLRTGNGRLPRVAYYICISVLTLFAITSVLFYVI